MHFVEAGDEIVISIAEHHSNLIPWQQVAKARGAVLKYMYLDDDGRIAAAEIENKITARTKIVAVTHATNKRSVSDCPVFKSRGGIPDYAEN